MGDAAEHILTEHLSYPPLMIIDDVINAVNEIAHKCVNGMETFLKALEKDKDDRLRGAEDDDVELMDNNLPAVIERIERGSLALETLLAASVDRNFDLFELYVLRNIFTIPKELIDGGWMRLEHHEDLRHVTLKYADLDKDIRQLTVQTQFLNELRQLMKQQLKELFMLQSKLKGCKLLLEYFQRKAGEHRDLQPLKDTLPYLIGETKKRLTQFEKLNEVLASGELKLDDTRTEEYVNRLTDRQLEVLGLSIKAAENPVDHEEELLKEYPEKDEIDVEVLSKLPN